MTCSFALIAWMAGALLTGSADMQSWHFEHMSRQQLQRAIATCPVAYLPVGINEWHGEQSACGLDALKAESLCRMAAESLGGVCLPTLWLAPDVSTPFDPTKYPRGTLTIDQSLYYEMAEELLTKIETMGFKATVYLSGHYPSVIPPVAEKLNARAGMRVVNYSENQVVQGMPAGDHAGAWETSVLMVLRPGLVDLTRLPALAPTTRPAGDAIPPDEPFRQRSEMYGVYRSDPRVWTSRYYGCKGVEAVMDGLAREVRKALKDDGYARDRRPIAWPGDVRQDPEVRYDFQLPGDWMKRFEAAPIVYWPLPAANESIEAATQKAIALARKHGGMVFPAFPYVATKDDVPLALSKSVSRRAIAEVVHRLEDMDFRVIALLPGESIDADVLTDALSKRVERGQTRVLSCDAAEPIEAAIRVMIPSRDATAVAIDDAWTIDGHWHPDTIRSAVYTPAAPQRVYERTIELNETAASGSLLLDLGVVENDCEVSVNGGPVFKDHWPPYRFVLTGMVKPGVNALKVVVKHQPQETLDPFYYRPAPPRLLGPVVLQTWKAP